MRKGDCKSVEERFWPKVNRLGEDDCWEWKAGRGHFGHGYIRDWVDGKWKSVQAHRLAWTLSGREIPVGLFVLHKCDNPPCCNPKHLFLGTQRDNVYDCIKKGRRKPVRGENKNNHKLDEEKVKEIRRLYSCKLAKQPQLSKMFSVHQSIICEVISRKRWAHVP